MIDEPGGDTGGRSSEDQAAGADRPATPSVTPVRVRREARGVTSLAPTSRPVALVVVDVQEGFVTAHTEATVPLIAAHVIGSRKRYGRVIATRFVNLPGSLYESERDWREMTAEPETRVLPVVREHADRLLVKHGLAPERDELVAYLRSQDVSQVDLCGFDTDQCVLATALQLWDAGIRPRVLVPLCSSSGGPEMHSAGLAILRRAIGDRNVTDLEGRPM
jgi:nicotinamidase-related amidase